MERERLVKEFSNGVSELFESCCSLRKLVAHGQRLKLGDITPRMEKNVSWHL